MMTTRYPEPKHAGICKRARICVLLTVMVVLTVAAAQADTGARGRWWQSPEIARQIQLTEAEIQQLDSAFDAAQLKMIELRSNVAVEKAKLRSLLSQPELDEAAIVAQHQNELAARALLSDARLAFLLEVRKLVGHERYIQLMDIRDRFRRHRHMDTLDHSQTTP